MIKQSYILIAGAVINELSGIIEQIEEHKHFYIGGKKIVSGNIGEQPVKIILTGPGIINCVHALTAVIEDSPPALILLTGCGGAFHQSGLGIGDIGIASTEIDIHMGIENDNDNFLLKDPPFQLLEKDGLSIKNKYPIAHILRTRALDILSNYFKQENVNVKEGPFITVSTITASNDRAEKLYKRFNPIMEAMEGTGGAHLAIHYGIPFLEIRAVSNMVGKRDISKWNLPLAFKNGSLAMSQIIQKIW
ncbi:MAG: futalosine hydrolase [Desulfobacteraceae bacterium 4572_19]|nr:MAG: futalosine hydrolase [Desulfobacteraceae bacterium 4572_19]